LARRLLKNAKFGSKAGNMGVRRGGQDGALAPPWPTKIVRFLTFLNENSMF